MKTKIAIFDENQHARNCITELLQSDEAFDVAGVYDDARDCVEKVIKCQAEVVLIDIAMSGMNGIDIVRNLKKELPHILILIQTICEEDELIFDSIRAGASGYILKSYLSIHLIGALKEMQLGGAPLTPVIARKVLKMVEQSHGLIRRPATHDYKLTPKEKEVLVHIVDGLSYKMIAANMNISYETVRSHVKKIYEKLHVASLTEVVAKAINQQLV
ncbi:DNA-binding response regulator [Niastella koreensis]|uniref:Two component transcriptional regulator, LuxR family n=2 Tax=Niastella koreensis TaxID=354356 RepID=G8TPF8_NIAKG|nr:response regulator transcription factor [Niastella koreensis]AEV97779.1 two component transcriptional regulator, LuxR family [Niastella koreensis GR20-10]OQP40409.1 DNA-binding response regulator [Niastella koreensis]